jgi:4-hydroxybenzoate polyprenyltransferase
MRVRLVGTLLDAFAFSSGLVACGAAALAAAASRALGLAVEPAVLSLAFCGTIAVYGIDRLRDLAHDTHTAPLRSAFVAAHARPLLVGVALSACAALAAGVRAGPGATLVAGIVAAFGLAHRRLKRRAWAKPLYLTGSWTAVCVGLPVAAAGASAALDLAALAWVAGIVGASLQANVILSNLRDAEGIAGRLGARRARWLAAAFCAAALGAALLAPGPVRALGALPLAMATAVAAFRPGERFGALAVDGALLLGAGSALALGSR